MKVFLSLLFFASPVAAGVPYWTVVSSMTAGTATGYLSGELKVYPSTSTASASPAISIDGTSPMLTVRDGATVSSMTPTGFDVISASATNFYGPLTGNVTGNLTGSVTGAASLNVLKAGDTMTGQLTTASTLTVQGNAFSVGGSTLVVTGGKVGVGIAAPARTLAVAGFIQTCTAASCSSTDGGYMYDDGTDLLIGNQRVGGFKIFTRNNSTQGIIIKTQGAGDGNAFVGIGTTAPASKLHVSSGVIYNDGTGAGIYTTGTSTAAAFYGAGTGLTGQADGLRVSTATYLATAPGNCVAGEFISGLTADGTKTCATPAGGGDVVLASTQTFTGDNTFEGSVTVSSFTTTGDTLFSGAASTTTFSGWIDFGFYTHTYTGGAGLARAACASGFKAISCGCRAVVDLQRVELTTETTDDAAVGTLVADGASNASSCSCSIGPAASVTAQVVCARIK